MDTLEVKTSLRMQCRMAFERLTLHIQKEVHACQCISVHASSHDVISADLGFCSFQSVVCLGRNLDSLYLDGCDDISLYLPMQSLFSDKSKSCFSVA